MEQEWVFPESVWRSIERIEWLSRDFSVDSLLEKPCKRVFGVSFTRGDFYLAFYPDAPSYAGPPTPNCVLFEANSGLIFSWAVTKYTALEMTREHLTRIPAGYLDLMFSKGIERQRAARAEREANAAIFKAMADRRNRPRNPSKRARAVFEAFHGKCHYCATALTLDGKWHVEHKMPKALGGDDAPGNLVASCAPCNHEKRDTTDVEFKAKRAARAA